MKTDGKEIFKYKNPKAPELGPAGQAKLWLYTSLLDHPDPHVVYKVAHHITDDFRFSQIDKAVWMRAKRRLGKFKVDKQTGEVLAVDPLFKLRGCKRGRPSRHEAHKVTQIGGAYELANLMDKLEAGELDVLESGE